MSCDDGTCLDCGRELTGPDGTDCAHCDAKQAASDKRRAEHGNELAVLRDEVKRLREENDRLRRRSVAACLDGVKALYDKAHAVWQANPGPSDWISEFEEAFESTCAALAAARDEARGCMPTGAGLATELAEARARCVELEGRVAAAERLAEEERGRSDRWKEAAELAARIAAPDAARKDLETARSVFVQIAEVRTCDHESCDYCGCDVGGGLYASGEEPEHHEDWCPTALAMRFLAAHPKP